MFLSIFFMIDSANQKIFLKFLPPLKSYNEI
jgi:hypothetical protein